MRFGDGTRIVLEGEIERLDACMDAVYRDVEWPNLFLTPLPPPPGRFFQLISPQDAIDGLTYTALTAKGRENESRSSSDAPFSDTCLPGSLPLPDRHPDRERHKRRAGDALLCAQPPRHANRRHQVPHAVIAPRPRDQRCAPSTLNPFVPLCQDQRLSQSPESSPSILTLPLSTPLPWTAHTGPQPPPTTLDPSSITLTPVPRSDGFTPIQMDVHNRSSIREPLPARVCLLGNDRRTYSVFEFEVKD